MTATAVALSPTDVLDAPPARRQLVLVDDSLTTEFTLAAAVSAARRHRASITLLAVVPDIVGDARRSATLQPGVPFPAALQEEADTDARRRLRDTVRRIPQDIPVTTTIRRGKPEPEIVAELAEHDYDDVVLGAAEALVHSYN
jgi:nucleotide-binding universal stress UspA family protein